MLPELDNRGAFEVYDVPVADLAGGGRPPMLGKVGCRDKVAIVGVDLLVKEESLRVKPVLVDMVSVPEMNELESSSRSGRVALAKVSPFFIAFLSCFLLFASSFSRAFLVFFDTMAASLVSIFLRQYLLSEPSALGM